MAQAVARWHGGPEVTGSSPVTPIFTMERPKMKEDLSSLALKTFLKAVEILGGFEELIQRDRLDWLSPILKACYVIVLSEEGQKGEEEIAELLKLSKQTIRNILNSGVHLLQLDQVKDIKPQTSGAVAKLAYKLVKDGYEESKLLEECSFMVAYALDVPWAYLLLRRIRGVEYPLKDPNSIVDKVDGIVIRGRPARDVLMEIDYPVKSPVELLRRIKENLKMHGLE